MEVLLASASIGVLLLDVMGHACFANGYAI
jgi:hypothetical protein